MHLANVSLIKVSLCIWPVFFIDQVQPVHLASVFRPSSQTVHLAIVFIDPVILCIWLMFSLSQVNLCIWQVFALNQSSPWTFPKRFIQTFGPM